MIENPSLLKQSDIQKGLSHPDPEIRIQSIKDLISLHDPSYIDQLLQLSEQETDVQIKFEIRKGIGLLRKLQLNPSKTESASNPNITKVEAALKSGQEEQIHKAFRYITQYRLKQFLPQMMKVANDSASSYLKGMVLKFMLSLGGEIYFEDISSYLNDQDPRVVSIAIETIESIGNTKALSLIAQLVTHEHNRVQATAMKALYNLGDSSALNLFKKMIRSKHTAYRNSAVYALKEMKIKSSIPLLVELLDDESQSVKEKAIAGLQALAEDGSQEACEALNQTAPSPKIEVDHTLSEQNLLSWIKDTLTLPAETARNKLLKCISTENPSDKCISYILSALARIGSLQDVPLVKKYLDNKNDRIRANAVECLAALLPEERLIDLKVYLSDFNNRVIGNAIMALYELYEEESLSALHALIKSNTKNEQLTAVFVMGAIGEDEFLKHSEYLLESSYPDVREKMIKILEDLSQDSAIAHRFIKQNQLRMAAFVPAQQQNKKKAEPKVFVETIEDIQPTIQLPKTSEVVISTETETQEPTPDIIEHVGHHEVEQVYSDEQSKKANNKLEPVLEFIEKAKGKLSDLDFGQNMPASDYEFSSLILLLLSFAFFTSILISSLILPNHFFISYISKTLRLIFLNNSLFVFGMSVILPLSLIYFYIQNKDQIKQEELIIGPIIGFSLFLFIPCTEALNLNISLVNFLSHDSIDIMFYQMPHYKPFAYVFFSLPLLILPVAIEALIINSALKKAVAATVSTVCVISIVWMGTLNQHSVGLLEDIKNENLYAYYYTQYKKAKVLTNDTRIRLLSAQASLRKKDNKKVAQAVFELKAMLKVYKDKQRKLKATLDKVKAKI
ncbi:MAG: HEAT repeat domain-containing protein [Candidatus Cloacimonetes bacterium]|nr:HEAT repeat domain-containing protein [Candidatus Cloacimonadota bacterium]